VRFVVIPVPPPAPAMHDIFVRPPSKYLHSDKGKENGEKDGWNGHAVTCWSLDADRRAAGNCHHGT